MSLKNVVNKIRLLVGFEFRRLIGFLRVEFSKKSRWRGAVVFTIGVIDMVSSAIYLGAGAGLIFMARADFGTAVRRLFGVRGDGLVGGWLSSRLGAGELGRWFTQLVNGTVVESLGRMLTDVGGLVSNGLIALAGVSLLVYGVAGVVISFGLLHRRKWAEYVAAMASVVYVPLELYAIGAYHSVKAVAALVAHVLIVWYLCKKKGLFSGYFAFDPNRRRARKVIIRRVKRRRIKTTPKRMTEIAA